ncbi:putative nucleotide-binding protein containing TIR-like domain protein [Botrimarina colliarenosi]|uniref:Putative nucleotide-binding protein containing TIR-like domain protein n=1 Tax=Botrimarina colliarenosi TaxID=2528001 RepID=A0A5C6AQM2_9BACT|nr:TIR domain-containing protein [Botrimarina colliarenosi]TWU00494.1 putative nucleotide-binding protein containing TIR-like domain protein [Botrimarina colliarenosi]
MPTGDAITRIRVFVASPGDVALERESLTTVINELNSTVASHKNCMLELVRWETHCQPDMGRAQEVINLQVGHYDIFVGIMWKRFGTPTGEADSGTEEEFRRAYSCWEKDRGVRILFYFSQDTYKLSKPEEVEQLSKVMAFRSELQEKGLVWEYSDVGDFKDVVRPHLARLILDLPDDGGEPPKLEREPPTPASTPVRVFISSSIEGLTVAQRLQEELRKANIEAVSWTDGFAAGKTIVGELDRVLDDCDAAVMVLTSGDAVSMQGQKHPLAPDSLIYEIGLFHGRRGRDRTFVLATEDFRLPSDLAGVAYLRYDQDRLDPVITQLRRELDRIAHAKVIAQQSFRVGQGIDPIDDATTVVVLKASVRDMEMALTELQRSFGSLITPPFDHGDGVYEVMIKAPVSSAQLSILARRCNIVIQSIDHMPEPYLSDVMKQLKRYMASQFPAV